MKNIINSVEKHYIISIDEKISKISLFQAIRSLTKNNDSILLLIGDEFM